MNHLEGQTILTNPTKVLEEKMDETNLSTVYHGSRVVVETPRILPARYAKDFGPGFYCEQAEEVSSD